MVVFAFKWMSFTARLVLYSLPWVFHLPFWVILWEAFHQCLLKITIFSIKWMTCLPYHSLFEWKLVSITETVFTNILVVLNIFGVQLLTSSFPFWIFEYLRLLLGILEMINSKVFQRQSFIPNICKGFVLWNIVYNTKTYIAQTFFSKGLS